MTNLCADFKMTEDGVYDLFLYSETDEINPVSVTINEQNLLDINGHIIDWNLLKSFQSGRVLQNSDGSFFVKENIPLAGSLS